MMSLSGSKRRLFMPIGVGLSMMVALALILSFADRSPLAAQAAPAVFDAAPMTFRANLSGAYEVPAVDSSAAGQAILALSADMSELHYRVMAYDIAGIQAAHIHIGQPGGNGSVVFWLYDATGVNGPDGDFGPGHPISGMLSLTPAQAAELLAGDYYINVHSSSVPSGEMRGQIKAYAPPADYNALLTGDAETTPVDTDAAGVAHLTLVTDTLTYDISVTDIVSITAAHIHKAPVGENGPVAHWLYDASGANAPGGDFDPSHPISGTVMLDAENLVDLLTGYFYINVHTENVSSGEVRGQLGRARVYKAMLSGENEVPPVETAASGKGVLALSADATQLHYRIMLEDIDNVTAAHIHAGAPDENGPVTFWLYDSSGVNGPGGAFGPGDPISGTLTLSDTHLFDLARGDYYINVHSSDVPSGEARGQVVRYDPSGDLIANLAGENEVPPVATDGAGVARFHLNAPLNALHYGLSVDGLSGIGAAHIHQGPRGENGPVVYWLYDASGVKAPGGDFDSDHPVGDGLTLDAWSLVDLLTGYAYVNIHTADHGSGELRGQVVRLINDVYLPHISK